MSDQHVQPEEWAELLAETERAPEDGTGLCLSGGGYRAMLFHAGVLWRLNEFGMLPRLKRVSSVSGGSITAGQLGMQWSHLTWQAGVALNFAELVIGPIRALAGKTIDVKSIASGILLPWKSVNDQVVSAYRKALYGDATLQDLPADASGPRFVINATNVQSGAIMRFSRPYVADHRVGRVDNPTVSIAEAVAASSAFPPVLSPAHIRFDDGVMQPAPGADLNQAPYTTNIVLTDGGVYDNLGLETVWKRYRTVLVSDGGGQMAAEPHPKGDWARHALRVNDLIDNQVRALRKRMIVGSLVRRDREGAYWRMRGNIAKYDAPKVLPCPFARTQALADTPTRLAKLDALTQERIINWGYALCDAGIRTWVDKSLPAPGDFPYPHAKV